MEDPHASTLLRELLIPQLPPDTTINRVTKDDPDPPDPTPKTAPTNTNGAGAAKRGRPAKKTTAPAATDDDPLAPATDVNGPVDPDDDDGDALGLAEPSLSPGEAHSKGLVLARELYNKGHKAAVKQLQASLGIAKFTDIPVSDGPKLYAEAKQLAEKVGLHV